MKIDHTKNLKTTRIISCFSQFHQELYLMRILQQNSSRIQIITFNQNSKNDLIQLLNHFNFQLEKNLFACLSNYSVNKKTVIYLSDFDQLAKLNQIDDLNDVTILLPVSNFKKLKHYKNLSSATIVRAIQPSSNELDRIKLWQKKVKNFAKHCHTHPEMILTEGQIRIISLFNYKSPDNFLLVPGIGKGWVEKWGTLFTVKSI